MQNPGNSTRKRKNSPYGRNIVPPEILRSRRDDAECLRLAFPGATQDEIASNASRELGRSKNTIISYLQCHSDMPSWAVKRAQRVLDSIERATNRIDRL